MIILKLKNSIIIKYIEKDNLCVLTFGVSNYEIEDPNKEYFEQLSTRKFKKDVIDEELLQFLIQNKLVINEYSKKQVEETYLKNIPFLENMISDEYLSPYSLHDTLFSSHVCILGCGGVGSIVLKNLAAAGVGNFTLIDGDFVDKSNLNRQLFFSVKDSSLYKTQVLKSLIKRDYPAINIYEHKTFIYSEEDIEKILLGNKIDIIINCADTPPEIVTITGKVAGKLEIPYIAAGVGIETGSWGPFYDRNNPYKEDSQEVFEYTQTEASFSPTNMIISAYLSYDVLLYLLQDCVTVKYEDFYKEKILNFQDFCLVKE